MSTLQTLAAQLGEDVMKAMDETGDDRLFMEIAGVIGAASQTLEEAFLTDVRVRLAERKARAALERKLAQHRASAPPQPAQPAAAQPAKRIAPRPAPKPGQ